MIEPLQLQLKLNGVDHTARPTWRLRETVNFYRDIMGLPLVHCITAKGWGREKENHADFLHFFFDSGNESTIAFFYYIGTRQPQELIVPKGYMAMANHTAWRVEFGVRTSQMAAAVGKPRGQSQSVRATRDH